ncbi:MAG: LysR family transcriptional regulator [Clostridia bacterium]|nr:LysR family transcriptional regulator [Clostridia bacterium]
MEFNISKYMAFVASVEYGSFTKAAELLHYTQSAISRMINDLETEWKISVLERSKTGVKLTSDGLKIFPYAKSICNEFQKLQMQIDELSGLQSGMIRVGTFSSVATHWLPNIIKAFQNDYPNIDYELLLGDYSEIETWILEGRVDCGFLRLPTHPELETIFLEQDKLLAVLPQNHYLTSKKKVSVSDLCNEPFMLLEKGTKAEISEIFEKNGLTPKTHFTTWDDYAVMSMVEKGLGISILPKLILKRIPYKIVTKELNVPAYRNIGLAMRNKKTLSLAAKKFIEYLQYR